jgi:hypothetical protein
MHRLAFLVGPPKPDHHNITVRLFWSVRRPTTPKPALPITHQQTRIIIFDRNSINMAIHFPHVHLRLGFLGT